MVLTNRAPLSISFVYAAMDASLLDGRVGVKWSNYNLELRVDSSLLFRIGTNERDSTDSFTI